MSTMNYETNHNLKSIIDSINLKIDGVENRPVFETALVVDYVSNPEKFLEKKVEIPKDFITKKDKVSFPGITKTIKNKNLYTSGMKVNDTSLLINMPPNSIIGYTFSENNPVYTVLFPFSPSHICTPVKPGEKVWFFYDKSNDSRVGYWLHRKTGTRFTEDVNYTDDARQEILSIYGLNSAETDQQEEDYKIALHSFHSNLNPERGYADQNLSINKIHSYSTAYREEFKGTVAVPNYKKCGDLVLQGSNNSKIILTNSDISNTSEIKILSGYKRDFPHKKFKNTRTVNSLKDLEYEEFDKYQGVLRKRFIFGQSDSSIEVANIDIPIPNIPIPKLTDIIPIEEFIPTLNIPDLSILNIPIPNLVLPKLEDFINIPNIFDLIPDLSLDFLQFYADTGGDAVLKSEDVERDGKYKITEPAGLIVKEYQSDQSFLESVTPDAREGFGLKDSIDHFTGNILLRTNSNNDILGMSRSAGVDMLGSKVKIDNSTGCKMELSPDGNIIILAQSRPLNAGPHVILGGNTKIGTEPVIKGDKLISLLSTLIDLVTTSVVPTPAGPSGPLTNSPAISALKTTYLTSGVPTYIGSNTTRVK